MLAEVRPYSFIIPPPYLAPVDNDDEKEKNEWKIIDEEKNDTDDDDAVQKRIMLFIYLFIYLYIRFPFFIYSYISFTFWWSIFRTFNGDPCRRKFIFSQVNERITRLLML